MAVSRGAMVQGASLKSSTVLAGSDAPSIFDNRRTGDVPDDMAFDVTVRLRRRTRVDPAGPIELASHETFDRIAFADLYGGTSADIRTVTDFATAHGITVTGQDAVTRSMTLRGTAAQYAQTFGLVLGHYRQGDRQGDRQGGGHVRGHEGGISLPPELATVVRAIIGFDTQRAAQGWLRRGVATGLGHGPAVLAAAYDFPAALDGRGQRIGVIGLTDDVPAADLESYRQWLGNPGAPPRLMPGAGDGWTSDALSGTDRDALGATLQLLTALAPGAELAVWSCAPTERGCIDALTAAIHNSDAPLDILCLGWGGAEDGWSVQAAHAINDILMDAALLGITVCAASGDHGSGRAPGSDDAAVTLPAACPFALACGGADLGFAPDGSSWETVWNDTGLGGGAGGGGVSAVFSVPPWQAPHGPPLSVRTARHGRGVPDVAASAAPFPGLLCVLDGTFQTCGGTALSAALWAALIARINQGLGTRAGFISPCLYAQAPGTALLDIHWGDNESTGRVGGYFAGPGWDACGGLGTPRGGGLLRALGDSVDQGPGPRTAPGVALNRTPLLTWTPLPGLVHDVGVAPLGVLWALGVASIQGMRPLFRSSHAGWIAVPGVYGTALAIAPGGMPWVTGGDGAIYAWDDVLLAKQPGLASAMAFAADGALWIVAPAAEGEDGDVARWNGSSFEPMGIAARQVRAGVKGTPLLLTAAGDALRFDGEAWYRVGRNLADVTLDADGSIWGISRTARRIWCRDDLNAAWTDVPAATAERLVALRGGGLLAIQRDGRLFSGRNATPKRPAP